MNPLRCGLIGANIGRSRLAAALAIMAEAHGRRLDFTPIDTAGDAAFDFPAAVDALRREGWDGVAVTHPWKTHAAAFAGAAMAPDAAELGAANLVLFRPLAGHNTDHSGFLAAWGAVMACAPGRVAMAGAGGVARAVAPALRRLGAEVIVWDRDANRAKALAAAFGLRAVDAGDAEAEASRADGLVNCTPRGMAPDAGSAFDADWIGPQAWAFDAVYTPTDTPFLQACTRRGLACLTGFDLFRFMAMDSFAALAGQRPDPGTTLPALDTLRPG
ncbi:shikimate dehydrogenase [Jannaschia sp. W003]|uniref:shikimate dehydrogenase family protein n=1 Tax=Jannaschia sp. W003 TaxID=2867012 RepID=UPI0021A85A80|nr:NAD(P)-binding domain-containing protein [Jannaschia sp. W003]UWQ20205.1 NAD(P)-binding domain-containing protein [Jannaschia sp. W003]